jgi:hypothetical protein
MWLAILADREEDSKPTFWQQFKATIEQQSRELSELIIRIQAQVRGLTPSPQEVILADLNLLSGFFSLHEWENPDSRDVRLRHIMEWVRWKHMRSWSEGKWRSVEVRTGKWYTESVERNGPISVDEILDMPAHQRRREFRFLLVYGITSEDVQNALKRNT